MAGMVDRVRGRAASLYGSTGHTPALQAASESSRNMAISLDEWASYFSFGGLTYPLIQTTMGSVDKERIAGNAVAAFQGVSPIFSLIQARVQLFSQVRFQWTRFKGSQPGDLFGTDDLRILERPWPNGSTAQLLARMEIDNSIAGNAYIVRSRKDRLARLRPDLVTIALGSEYDMESPADAPDVEVAGYAYFPRSGKPEWFWPWEVAHYCVDEETEILTVDGWKTLDTLTAGDTTLTLDHRTGQAVWQPVTQVCIFPAMAREMISMEGSEHSSLTTPNHRWPVERKNSRAGTYERRWATTETLSSGDRIPVSAPPYAPDMPSEPKISDALVELVAWFYTEGCIAARNGRPSRAISISQSWRENPEHAERIGAALTAVFGPPVADQHLPHSVARWNANDEPRGMRIFKLNSAASDVITEHAPGKVPSTIFLRSLTAAQLELFIRVSMLADNGGPGKFGQSDKARAEQFALACILAGYAVSMKQRESGMWMVRMLRKKHVYPQQNSRATSVFQVRRVGYTGRVWCPRTPNQTWLARRHGNVYFTGNTTMPDPNFQFLGMSWMTPALREIQSDALTTEHKYRYFANGTTPGLAFKFDPSVGIEAVKQFKQLIENEHAGAFNAYRNIYLGGGADPVAVGANLQQLDFAITQGHAEARLAANAAVPASWVGFSEGLQGSSLNAGNFNAQRRRLVDGSLWHWWTCAAQALEAIVQPPDSHSNLWFDARIPAAREDAQDIATIQQLQAQTISALVMQGFTPESVTKAVVNNDMTLLRHSGALSVQLHKPGEGPLPVNGTKPKALAGASNGSGGGQGTAGS